MRTRTVLPLAAGLLLAVVFPGALGADLPGDLQADLDRDPVRHDLLDPQPEATVDLEQFRAEFLAFGEALFALSPVARYSGDDGQRLAWIERVQALDEEQLRILYDSIDDRRVFADIVENLTVLASDGGPGYPVTRAVPGHSGTLFEPEYSTICGFLLENEDIVNGVRIAYYVAQGAAIVAQALCDAIVVVLGEGTNAVACAAAGVANGVAEVARQVIEQDDKCNQDIAMLQNEATFENVNTIFEAVRCIPVGGLLRGHGCDGADNDCDIVFDDCAEDITGPEVHIDGAVYGACFDDATEAAAAVAAAVRAVDDCRGVSVGAPVVGGTECDVPVSVTATDDCDNDTTASTTVKIDADGADIQIDPAVAGVCYATLAGAEAAVLGATSMVDNCDSGADLTATVVSSVTDCFFRVRVEVVDDCGNKSSAAETVRVDTEIPTVEIERLLLGFRSEVLGFQTPACYDTAAEAEAAVLAVTRFADNCTPTEVMTTTVSSSGPDCSLLVTATGSDNCDNDNTDAVTVRVDDVDPVVTCSVAVSSLWPPNHEMVDVGFSWTATDDCTGVPDVVVAVTSDEPTAHASGAGQASPSPDAEILRDPGGAVSGIRLRAERSQSGDGRAYAIHVTATDECGNVGSATCGVTVAPSSSAAAVDSGQYYDATAVN